MTDILEGSTSERFNNVLADYHAEREPWFAFREGRLREAMEEWLADDDTSPRPNRRSKRPEARAA